MLCMYEVYIALLDARLSESDWNAAVLMIVLVFILVCVRSTGAVGSSDFFVWCFVV